MTLEQLFSDDLHRQIPSEELIKASSEHDSFLALYREHMTSYIKGTAILIPDWSTHAANAKHIDHLRQELNDYGWQTLSIMPPEPPQTPLTPDALTQYQQSLKSRIEAVTKIANQQPGVHIIIAQGANAATLNKLYAENQLKEPAAFIMLSAYLPETSLNNQLAKLIASNQIPTLDLSHQFDNPYVDSQLKLRRQMVQKHLKPIYRQRQIVGAGYHIDEKKWVLQEIYGWLGSVGL